MLENLLQKWASLAPRDRRMLIEEAAGPQPVDQKSD